MGDLINVWSVVFHLVNLVILYVGLKFLLYKPVKAFMEKREAEYAAVRDQIEVNQQQAALMKAEYEEKMKTAQEEAARIVSERADMAQRQANEVIQSANDEAHAIIAQAEKEGQSEKVRKKEEMRQKMIDLSVEMAQQVLAREINAEDHQKLFDEFLDEVG